MLTSAIRSVRELGQIRGSFFQFHHQHLAFAESDIMLVKKTADPLGVADNHARDGGFGRVLDAEGQGCHVVLVHQFDDFEQRAHLVLKEDRKLPHLGAVEFLGGGSRHDFACLLKLPLFIRVIQKGRTAICCPQGGPA